MADRNSIITLPNPHLRTRSKKVGFIDDKVKQIIQDMKDATLDWEAHRDHEFGVALAAVQIDILYRIVVVRADLEDKANTEFTVFINPKIAKASGTPVYDYEGCLSIKDVYGKVPRYPKIKVDALDEEGREFRATLEGFPARVMQHEIDHTNGVVFIDHIRDVEDGFFKLDDDGKLTPLDYEQDVKENSILWE